MKTIIRKIYLIISGCAVSSAACAVTNAPVAIDSTINALDYVLQRPAPAHKFTEKRFGDRLFLSVEGGPQWMRPNSRLNDASTETGYRVGISVGDWITPVHGWRLGLSTGRHYGLDGNKPVFAAMSLDYMMNLSALLRGDNPSRRFELIGIMGIEGQALHRDGHRLWGAGGARIALQPRLYVTPATYLYIEPRLGVYDDRLDDVKTWHKYDWNASVMIGLGYRMTGGRGLDVDNSMFINNHFRDNMFVSLSGGIVSPGSNTYHWRHRIGPTGTVSVGKWFSAPAGLRLSLGGAELRHISGQKNRYSAIADIDWMWNLNSAFVGYNPDSRIETNIVLGASAACRNGEGRKFYPGLHGAVQGIWKVSPSVGLYLEPNMRLFDNEFANTNRRFALMPGVNVGLVYRFNSSEKYDSYKSSFNYDDFLTSRRYFFDLLGGVMMRSRSWHPNCAFALGFGKWFTPESAWRINGEYESIRTTSNYRSLSLSADYLLSLSTLAGGFDNDRIFDLDAFVGLTGGAAHYRHNFNNLVWGPRAGLRGRFAVSRAVDIILEPQVQILSIPDYTRRFNPEARLLAGISYKIGRTQKEKTNTSHSDNPFGDFRAFVNLSGGPMLYSENFFNSSMREVSGGFNASLGGWLTDVSGLQAAFSYDCLPYNRHDKQEIKTLSLDYLLNLTSFFTGESGHRFEISPLVGVGIGWGSCRNSKSSVAVESGLRANWRLSKNIDLTLTPMVTAWQPRINGSNRNGHHFVSVGRLPVGVTYRF